MQAESEAMELSWGNAHSQLERIKQMIDPKLSQKLPIGLSNGEILANFTGNSSDME